MSTSSKVKQAAYGVVDNSLWAIKAELAPVLVLVLLGELLAGLARSAVGDVGDVGDVGLGDADDARVMMSRKRRVNGNMLEAVNETRSKPVPSTRRAARCAVSSDSSEAKCFSASCVVKRKRRDCKSCSATNPSEISTDVGVASWVVWVVV